MSMRDDGIHALVWSKAEDEDFEDPAFNIELQLFSATGDPIGDPLTVNEPSDDPENSTQFSPSVSFDGAGNRGR